MAFINFLEALGKKKKKKVVGLRFSPPARTPEADPHTLLGWLPGQSDVLQGRRQRRQNGLGTVLRKGQNFRKVEILKWIYY